MSEGLRLRHGADYCDVYPGLGGSLTRWSVAGQDMLRVADPDAIASRDPLRLASFPLVPYSNRIGHARFEWAGQPIALTPNFAPEPHAIHGVGWQRPWAVVTQTEAMVTLALTHHADSHWPWSFDATQSYALANDTLTMTLRATNRAKSPVPLGFGHHPYFAQDGATLCFAAESVWMVGDDALPSASVTPHGQFDFSTSNPVSGRSIDHCYAGVEGPAVIDWADRLLGLEICSSPQMPAAVVYVPDGGDTFCFEPVPHINNALNLPGERPAMPVLAPNETTETIMTFRVIRR